MSYWTYFLCNKPRGTFYIGMTGHHATKREKTLKRWPRAWKIALVERSNPDWHDLFDGIV